jgi:hypothetical protein
MCQQFWTLMVVRLHHVCSGSRNVTFRECQLKAQDEGYDHTAFTANFPIGRRQCLWIDAYLGALLVEGDETKGGMVMARQIERQLPRLEVDDVRVLTPEERAETYAYITGEPLKEGINAIQGSDACQKEVTT